MVVLLIPFPATASAQDYRDAYPRNLDVDMVGYVFELTFSDETDVVSGVATATAHYRAGRFASSRLAANTSVRERAQRSTVIMVLRAM